MASKLVFRFNYSFVTTEPEKQVQGPLSRTSITVFVEYFYQNR